MAIKNISLQTAFWKFLIMMIAGLLGAFIIPFSIFLVATTFGIATSSNSSEKSVKSIAPILAAAPDLSEVQLPAGCEFLRLDKNYQLIETTLKGDNLQRAMEYAKTGITDKNLNKQYLLITRKNEYIILQYFIGSQFTNDWINEHLPSPEVILYILIGINCIAVCIFLTKRFSKNLQLQLIPLFKATAEVSKQNLDFTVGHSKIKEFEAVLLAFSEMKNSLKISLEQQWKSEQIQKEQIAALAHDLKTPLTVILGNIDLINETDLNEEQKQYTKYIIDSSEQIQSYIKILIDISRATIGYQIHKQKVKIYEYINYIQKQINSLCQTKNINLKMNTPPDYLFVELDTILIERAIMNVVNNAIDYSPLGGTLYITIKCQSDWLQIIIKDEGKGFSQKALQYAKESFFMDNQSRSSKMHFGMGLYITSSILQEHEGHLILENDTITHGAKVIIKIPISN